jgi:2-polyprenyl-6-methoxyphenol hydroxylase-like FAD-dependent oxidoreductase
VLIVGAGPVGMVLACDLLAQGVSVRLVDKLGAVAENDPHSRAILVVPRVLELLQRIGVSDELVAAGRKVRRIGYYSEGRRVSAAVLDQLPDTPFPFMLALPQRETERVLRRRLHALGGTVEHGVSLEELDSGADRARAVLRHADGSREDVTADYVVGADGAASTTRKLLDLQLTGDDTDVTYVIADAPIDGELPEDAHYFYSRDGLVAVIPMPGGLYRIAANVGHDVAASATDWQELLQSLVARRAGLDLTVGKPTYLRTVRPRCGVAERFRSGRVFLVGDAAHVITPAGGQGMNLGIQDAANLAWKLGGVLAGRLDPQVLDSYQEERTAAAKRTAGATAKIVGLALQRSKAKMLMRDVALWAADHSGMVQRTLTPLLSQLDVDYGRPQPLLDARWGPAVPGQRVPLFARSGDGKRTGAHVLHPVDYSVVFWPGRARRGSSAARVQLNGQLPTPVVDLGTAADDPALRRAFGNRPALAVVRPDGHLAHVARPDQTNEIRRFLLAAATAPGPVPVHPAGPRTVDPVVVAS